MCGNPFKVIIRAFTPKKPKSTPPPAVAAAPPAVDTSAEVAKADEEARRRAASARGRASTVMTGGSGDTSTPVLATQQATGRRTLLG